jgi:hypothetical protein
LGYHISTARRRSASTFSAASLAGMSASEPGIHFLCATRRRDATNRGDCTPTSRAANHVGNLGKPDNVGAAGHEGGSLDRCDENFL